MNSESLEILRNARADLDAGKIERWQYEDIVKSVMRTEIEIYCDGQKFTVPLDSIYIPAFARQA